MAQSTLWPRRSLSCPHNELTSLYVFRWPAGKIMMGSMRCVRCRGTDLLSYDFRREDV